jgi:hypothetical protein
LEDNPQLLTSDAVHGSRRMLRLVSELHARGAGTIAVPLVPGVRQADVAEPSA